jgi:hypothetical protein
MCGLLKEPKPLTLNQKLSNLNFFEKCKFFCNFLILVSILLNKSVNSFGTVVKLSLRQPP